jgi:hypothetical protein
LRNGGAAGSRCIGRASLEALPRRKRGRYTPTEHLHRDHVLMYLMVSACLRFDVQPTRDREMKDHPSGASLVAEAVRRPREVRLAIMWSEDGGWRAMAAIQSFISLLAKSLAAVMSAAAAALSIKLRMTPLLV